VHTSLPRASAVIAAAVAVSASALIGSAQPAFAYNSCWKTYSSQQTWVSVTCPAPQPGISPYALFRAATYSCAQPGSMCSNTPIYGNWVPLNSTSTAYGGGGYVDLNRVTVQYQFPD